MNDYPIPREHGFPARLIVPGYYGMASVKWLRSVTVLDRPVDGVQQRAYRYRRSDHDDGRPVDVIRVRSLIRPAGQGGLFDAHPRRRGGVQADYREGLVWRRGRGIGRLPERDMGRYGPPMLIDDLNELDHEIMDHDQRKRLWRRVLVEIDAFSVEEWKLVSAGARDALVRLVRRGAHVSREYDDGQS